MTRKCFVWATPWCSLKTIQFVLKRFLEFLEETVNLNNFGPIRMWWPGNRWRLKCLNSVAIFDILRSVDGKHPKTGLDRMRASGTSRQKMEGDGYKWCDFDVSQVIGAGQFSTVYRARVRNEDRFPVALKRVKLFGMCDSKARADCVQEIQLLKVNFCTFPHVQWPEIWIIFLI